MTHYNIFWTSLDGQGSIDMSGEYDCREIQDAIAEAWLELRSQAGEQYQLDNIDAGRIEVVE